MRQMEKIFFMILCRGKSYTIIRFFRKHFDGSSHEFTFLHPSLRLHCCCPSIIPAVTSSSLTLQSSLYLAARVMFFSNSMIGVTSLQKIFQLVCIAFRRKSNPFPQLLRLSRLCLCLRLTPSAHGPPLVPSLRCSAAPAPSHALWNLV